MFELVDSLSDAQKACLEPSTVVKTTVHSAQADPARSDRLLMSHVLLVDDDPKILDLVASYLRGHHFEVSSAANGQEALSWMAHNRADIVLLDIMMPVMDGLETLRQPEKRFQCACDHADGSG